MARAISWTDRLIALCDQGLRTVAGSPQGSRPSPADSVDGGSLSPSEQRLSAALMRVNRAGEISAQALYAGQALAARNPATVEHLAHAAGEEADHLAWCNQRLSELGGRGSLLDPAWFLGSAAIGVLAGLSGDAISLGFIAETERQVEAHIDDHLHRLPDSDRKTRAILEQMADDEARHGRQAASAGGARIREPVLSLMALGGGILRQIALRV
jgi:ubiquinone biosynthesis monooxygenase Coq7